MKKEKMIFHGLMIGALIVSANAFADEEINQNSHKITNEQVIQKVNSLFSNIGSILQKSMKKVGKTTGDAMVHAGEGLQKVSMSKEETSSPSVTKKKKKINEEELKEAKASQETTANEKNGVLKAMVWLRDKATHNNNTQEAQIEKTPGMSL